MKRRELIGSLVCAALLVAIIWFLGSRNPEYFAQTDPLAGFWQKIEQRWGKGLQMTGSMVSGSIAQDTGNIQNMSGAIDTGANLTGGTSGAVSPITGEQGLPEGMLTGVLTLEQYQRLERDVIGHSTQDALLLQRCSPSSRYCSQFFRETKQAVYTDAFTGKLLFVPLFTPLSAGDSKDMYVVLSCLQSNLSSADRQSFAEALYKQEGTLTQDRITTTAQTLGFAADIATCTEGSAKYSLRVKLQKSFIKELFGDINQLPFNVFIHPVTHSWVSIPGLYDDVTMFRGFDMTK